MMQSFLPRIIVALFIFLQLMSLEVGAQSYPTRPVKILVPFPPGAGVDIVTRLIANKLSLATGQQFIIENRSGAGGNVGAAEAARATPDGYTLLAAPSSIALSQSLFKNLPFNADKDFRAIGLMASVPFVLVVNPSVPAKTLPELISLAKSQPGVLTYASTGNGSSPQLTAEMFKSQAQIDIRHVPYRGSAPALTDLISGQVTMMFANALSVLPHVQSGSLRALAVTGLQTNASFPDLPTMAKAGLPGFESETWFILLAPTGTPNDIIQTLNARLVEVSQQADTQNNLSKQVATTKVGSPAQADAFLKKEIEKYSKIIKNSGIQID
ncbi:tripartite tricarboxylate transporter substrate binding protein [Polynucleobacter sp. Latsch14-2]|jgi:tripartite-type tricarboxylate transporter receptor subunit TctC|uniref:Bug family tripartite tricarboxylate transporter substrate binding protein n=1 Tax=Polynucleobacter sp. Latsch14-2 TaxID=2576920 RepID=UPI001C0A94AB|nr:tripartite tricarboxylate transporter substrate binding protein [Polynucleobacter sp. Latsch14-2]MBU3615452.1 tripartite tricarboxylate transporter substrate binding protein [Polynucleobacter sp. Latsch14-2]